MKSIFLSKRAKIIVDILLAFGFIVAYIFSDIEATRITYWKSFHCIMGITWFILIITHVVQHLHIIKYFTRKKVILRNKITTLIIICFILMLSSILSLIIGTEIPILEFHNVIGHVFISLVIIHAADRAKRFISLFKDNKKTKQY
ncbi:MAG: hypothetical protein LBQ84_04085 [Flavobacteriaceae bacterium]|jgi:hypothetical protein|nr:hypothetical protein [Flavobacteriaceae bacterium]